MTNLESADKILKQRINLLYNKNKNLQISYEDSIVYNFFTKNKLINVKEGSFYKVNKYYDKQNRYYLFIAIIYYIFKGTSKRTYYNL